MTFSPPQWPMMAEVMHGAERGVIVGITRASRFSNEDLYMIRKRDGVEDGIPASKVRFLERQVETVTYVSQGGYAMPIRRMELVKS